MSLDIIYAFIFDKSDCKDFKAMCSEVKMQRKVTATSIVKHERSLIIIAA